LRVLTDDKRTQPRVTAIAVAERREGFGGLQIPFSFSDLVSLRGPDLLELRGQAVRREFRSNLGPWLFVPSFSTLWFLRIGLSVSPSRKKKKLGTPPAESRPRAPDEDPAKGLHCVNAVRPELVEANCHQLGNRRLQTTSRWPGTG